jgi:hypothetical protein
MYCVYLLDYDDVNALNDQDTYGVLKPTFAMIVMSICSFSLNGPLVSGRQSQGNDWK